ncbi:hypothetical protein FDB28_12625 [Clostridium botulinum]|nr:hypothetical protein [Clostridium botulinum]NFS95862.1 hypothetical protein [Clostridium botulinum]
MENKNVDIELFGQLKGINFEYLVQLKGLIEDAIERDGADTLSDEMVIFDITLFHVVKERCNELINAEKRVKEIVEEDRKKDSTVKYLKELSTSYVLGSFLLHKNTI